MPITGVEVAVGLKTLFVVVCLVEATYAVSVDGFMCVKKGLVKVEGSLLSSILGEFAGKVRFLSINHQ